MKAKTKYWWSIILIAVLSIGYVLTSLLIEETIPTKIILTVVFLLGNSFLSIHFVGKYKEEIKDEKTKGISSETKKEERKQIVILGIEQLNKILSMLKARNFNPSKFEIVARKMVFYLNEFLDIEIVFGNSGYNTLTFNRVKYKFTYFTSIGKYQVDCQKGGNDIQSISDGVCKEFMTDVLDYIKKNYQIEI